MEKTWELPDIGTVFLRDNRLFCNINIVPEDFLNFFKGPAKILSIPSRKDVVNAIRIKVPSLVQKVSEIIAFFDAVAQKIAEAQQNAAEQGLDTWLIVPDQESQPEFLVNASSPSQKNHWLLKDVGEVWVQNNTLQIKLSTQYEIFAQLFETRLKKLPNNQRSLIEQAISSTTPIAIPDETPWFAFFDGLEELIKKAQNIASFEGTWVFISDMDEMVSQDQQNAINANGSQMAEKPLDSGNTEEESETTFPEETEWWKDANVSLSPDDIKPLPESENTEEISKRKAEHEDAIQTHLIQSEQKVQIFAFNDALNDLEKALTIAQQEKIEDQIPIIEQKIAQMKQSQDRFVQNQTELQFLIDEETKHENVSQWADAIADCDTIVNVAPMVGKNDIVSKYTEIRKSLLEKIEEKKRLDAQALKEQEKAVTFFYQLANTIKKNQELKQWETAISNCQKIIEIAPKAKKEEDIHIYREFLKDFQVKQEEFQQAANAEKQLLTQNLKSLEAVINVERNVLPQIEEFKIEDVIGNLSSDIDQMMNQLESLLEKQRVEIKSEATSRSVLKSATGEVIELQKINKIMETQTIAPSKAPSDEAAISPSQNKFHLHSELTNSFDDVIEEAILSDTIPYNFEVTEIMLNGEKPTELPLTEMTKEGLQFQWRLNDIAPKQEINITYDLRKRISRTIILPLEQQIKVIKTHTNLDPLQLVGLYDAKMTFANRFQANVKGIVIEDIIPMNYIFQIREPDKQSHADAQETVGTLVKWNLKTLADGASTLHEYLLLELYRFEELKIQTHTMCEDAYKDLIQADLQTSVKKYQKIQELLDKYY